mgnify:CR=1 FL=1
MKNNIVSCPFQESSHQEKQVKEKSKNSTDVRFRLTNELHEPLKDMAKKEQRSMNYLMNKAVELLIKQESAKA